MQEEKQEKVVISPHLSLTHMELQDGAANGRNVSLLMKSDLSSLTEEQILLLKSIVGEESIEKTSSNGLKKILQEALNNSWQGAFLLDFNDKYVIYDFWDESTYEYVYAVEEFSVDGNKAVLSGNPIKVNRIISYESESGSVVLSEKVGEDIGADVLSLIKSTLPTLNENPKVRDIFKTKHEEGVKLMKEEIQKAVDGALAPVMEELTKTKELLEKEKAEKKIISEKLDEIMKAAEDKKQQERLEKLNTVIKDKEEAQELHKSLAGVDCSVFDQVFKSLQAKNKALQGSHLFKQFSEDSMDEPQEESYTAKLLKQKYAQQQ